MSQENVERHCRVIEAGWVFLWEQGLIARLSTHGIDEARAAAERLAEEGSDG